MKVTDTTLDGHVVIGIDGDLDHANIGVLRDLVAAHLSNGNHALILDLSGCSYIGSAGLGAIMSFVRALQGKGTIAVVAPSPDIRRVMEIVGLPAIEGFHIYDDLATASSALLRDA